MALFILFRKRQLRTSDSLTLSFFLTLILAAYPWAIGLVEGKVLGLLLAGLASSILLGVVDN